MNRVRTYGFASTMRFALPLVVVPAALAACGSKPSSSSTPSFSTPPIIASQESATLAMSGIDTKNAPDLDKVGKESIKPIMHSFADSLGVECSECHAPKMGASMPAAAAPPPPSGAGGGMWMGMGMGMGGTGMGAMGMGSHYDFDAWTPNKHIAAKMWSEFVQKLAFKNGDPLYCDSCHQKKAKFLDRSDDSALGDWMHQNFVEKLVQKDGQPLQCATCHGKPFDGQFLDKWAAEPAPMKE
jgi:hypothetical protein